MESCMAYLKITETTDSTKRIDMDELDRLCNTFTGDCFWSRQFSNLYTISAQSTARTKTYKIEMYSSAKLKEALQSPG